MRNPDPDSGGAAQGPGRDRKRIALRFSAGSGAGIIMVLKSRQGRQRIGPLMRGYVASWVDRKSVEKWSNTDGHGHSRTDTDKNFRWPGAAAWGSWVL